MRQMTTGLIIHCLPSLCLFKISLSTTVGSFYSSQAHHGARGINFSTPTTNGPHPGEVFVRHLYKGFDGDSVTSKVRNIVGGASIVQNRHYVILHVILLRKLYSLSQMKITLSQMKITLSEMKITLSRLRHR